MSDRIVILDHGTIQQIGLPEQLYNRPDTRFVADFLGKSNFLKANVRGQLDGALECESGGERFNVAGDKPSCNGADSVLLALRPERIRIGAHGTERFHGVVRQTSYLGERCHLIVDHPGFGGVLVSAPTWRMKVHPEAGGEVSFGWDDDACVVLAEDQ